MTRRRLLRIKKATLVFCTGIAFMSLSCVQTAADAVGTGISLTGLLTPGAPANPVGVGLDFLADLMRFGS